MKTLVEGAPQVLPCYFIFGNSLLDNGNNNGLYTLVKANYAPYGVDFREGRPTGRFTNGRNTADFLAELLGFNHYIPPFASAKDSDILEGVNYASGLAVGKRRGHWAGLLRLQRSSTSLNSDGVIGFYDFDEGGDDICIAGVSTSSNSYGQTEYGSDLSQKWRFLAGSYLAISSPCSSGGLLTCNFITLFFRRAPDLLFHQSVNFRLFTLLLDFQLLHFVS
ncbi:hypothetical protein T459_05210 [Capsicum annuum]|uniref:GDSL esterase/lipase n=1 Tax=Capsicum annuum TaxID=4072 RepID=A0A2G3A791_CAPAN|nr:hypothetical protein FXO37_04097 [Capsicum annuum]PHT90097.1 hypothetical protein T459_05210 [Capsicum annuum]